MYITLVELPEYIRDANSPLDEESQDELKDFLARNPPAGRMKVSRSKAERNKLSKLVSISV